MTARKHEPTRALPPEPDLAQLKRQAKALLKGFLAADPGAIAEVTAHYRDPRAGSFALHDAQLVLARSYGFASWPALKAFVNGVTVRRLSDAAAAGRVDVVRSMLAARPELATLDMAEDDEHRALHYAVLHRQPDVVRVLMRHGADPRKGIWPHRGATSPLTLADERGYAEIAAIIREEEKRRTSLPSVAAGERTSDVAGASKILMAFGEMFGRGPEQTARRAVARGDENWLRARHAEGALAGMTGLISHGVECGREDMVRLLIDLGLDPDESGRVAGLEETVPTWGGPLRACAMAGNVATAEVLLAHGANPNTNVYAASSALSEAYARGDGAMIALLEQHGGRLTPVFVGSLGLADRAASLLADDAAERTPEWLTLPNSSVARDLLWGAIECPAPPIVRMALERIDWPRDDSRWHSILENGLYFGRDSNRTLHIEGFRLVLARCDPNVRSGRGTTLLHEIAASRGGLIADDRVALASLLIDTGARLDVRDDLLASTPLGWACRWGRIELVKLLLERGADPIEPDAEPWATPLAWAEKMGRRDVMAAIRSAAL